MRKNNLKYWCSLFIIFLLTGCVNGQSKIYSVIETNLKITNDSIAFSFDRKLLSEVSIDYSHNGFNLSDLKNHWEKHFSQKYFDVTVKYVDTSYLIVYCEISGIMNGYLIFPKKRRHAYLIDRKKGTVVVDIKSVTPIANASIVGNNMYIRCYDPNVVRFLKYR